MYMRVTVINGIEDKLHLEIPVSVQLFCIVSEKGKALNPLTYVAKLTGKELLDVLKESRFPNAAGLGIKENNNYEVIIFDD